MACEMRGISNIDNLRYSKIKFPPNWKGELPCRLTREELRDQLISFAIYDALSDVEIKRLLDFYEGHIERFYELKGYIYHRVCGGGSVVMSEDGVFCAKCGRIF